MPFSFERRVVLVGVVASAALLAATVGRAPAQKPEPRKPDHIVVNAAGGAVNKALREAFFSEFERRYGIRVVDTSPTDFGKLRAMVQSGNAEWAATEINEADGERASRMNLLEPLDRTVIDLSGFPKDIEQHKYLLTRGIYTTVLGYRTDTFAGKPHPQTWAEFWDVRRFPGPRSLRNSPIDNLEFALLADGVKPENLYPLDVDRAFRKLDEIKKHVAVWWTTGAQSAQLLIDKEVVMGTAWHGRFYTAIKDGAPIAIEWGEGLIHRTPFGIPRGSKDAYWGQRFLAILAEPQAQARYANLMSYPGLHRDAIRYTDPKILPFLPTHPENLKKQAWANPAWWFENGEKATERWSRWMLAR
ncbi:MAG: ABC transporter substrate-binding protein [Candidatus Rokubacteria bacterium]|nr:ABC transporter substrate-binding protein [Candidatus Rokubacteria bacterium]